MTMRAQRGFNMVDLMVGLAISLFGLLAVAKVLIDFNKQRNTTTQSLEAQSNGTMALYLIERDLTQAGYGLMSIQDCSAIYWYYGGTAKTLTTVPPALTTLPVKITDGGTGSDSLEVQYGASSIGVPSVLATDNQASFGNPIAVASIVGLNADDLILADANGQCAIYQVASVNTVARTLALTAGSSYPYNPGSSPGTGWGLIAPNNVIVTLGSASTTSARKFIDRRYTISAGALQAADFPTYGGVNLVDGIVMMKAQYGMDTNLDGTVDQWVDGGTAIDNTNVKQVIAIRIGILARNELYEKDAVDAPATVTLLPAISGITTMAAPTAGACSADATTREVICGIPDTHYRYKTYYTIIPLRNVIWGR
jgi:type IV pilus assembly protein PilW